MVYLLAITIFHTVLSLLAIAIGMPAVAGLFRNAAPMRTMQAFIASAVATSATGFLFPFKGVTPINVTGFIALDELGAVLLARGRFWAVRVWRRVYSAGLVASLYLLVFVGAVQAFLKLPALHQLASKGSEPPFVVTQMPVLGTFLALGTAAAMRACGLVQPSAGALPASPLTNHR